MLPEKKQFLSISLIILIILTTYFPSLWNGFVYDDWDLVIGKNRYEKTKSLLYPFIGDLGQGVYRPLRDISHRIDRFIWKEDPMGHHITNVLIHTVTAIVIFYISLSIFGKVIPSFLAAVFFGIHPIVTESVSWISGRRDILCGLFYFTGLLMFLRYYHSKRKWYLPAIFLCYILSFSSKEMGVTLPLVLILFDCFFMARKKAKSCLKYIYIPLLILAIVFSLLTLDVSTGQKKTSFYGSSRYLTLLAMSRVTAGYVKLLVFPVGLCADHKVQIPVTVKNPPVLISLFIILILFGIIYTAVLRKDRVIAFSILWFFITLLPVSNIIVPVKNMMAERYLYIPSAGFCILLAVLLHRIKIKGLAAGITLMIMVSYSCLTVIRNRDWRDDLSLWEITARQSPAARRPIYNLGHAYSDRGMYEEAITQLKKVIAIAPYTTRAYIALGYIYDVKGLHKEAKKQFETALKLEPLSGTAHYNLAVIYQKEDNHEEAIKEFRKALTIDPDNSLFHYGLASAYEHERKWREVIYHYGEAINLDPSNIRAMNNLGMAYCKLGMYDKAMFVWHKALEIDPDFEIVKNNLKGLENLLKHKKTKKKHSGK